MITSEKAQEFDFINSNIDEDSSWEFKINKTSSKRVFDLTLSIFLLPLLLPILALLIILIKFDSRGPAIYKSQRIGKSGRKFYCFKLRTMVLNANQVLTNILERNPELREEWERDHKLKNDPRITRIGKIIRTLSLDELPQILNVIRGEMSFVGPRPIVEAEIEKYGIHFSSYTSVRPGITGPWQTSGRNDIPYNERVLMDKNYARQNSFLLDLKIILKTIPAALSRKGAY